MESIVINNPNNNTSSIVHYYSIKTIFVGSLMLIAFLLWTTYYTHIPSVPTLTFSLIESIQSNKVTTKSNCSILWFYHISKSGGTALNELFKQKLGNQNHMEFWKHVHNDHKWMNATAFYYETVIPFIMNLSSNCENGMIHQHHMTPGMLKMIHKIKQIKTDMMHSLYCNCRLILCTLFREPIVRTKSSLGYNHINHKNALHQISTILSNYQIRYLLFNHPQYFNVSNIKMNEQEMFEKSIDILNEFDVIGVTEKYNEFVEIVDNITNFDQTHKIKPFKYGETPIKNVFTFTEYERNMTRKYNEYDSKLYQLLVKRISNSNSLKHRYV
eukprot:226633_1